MKTVHNRIDQSVKYFGSSENIGASGDRSAQTVLGNDLKSALVKHLSAEFPNVPHQLVAQSVNEAYALGMLEGEALLMLPALAEEKVQQAAQWAARQNALLQGNSLSFAE